MTPRRPVDLSISSLTQKKSVAKNNWQNKPLLPIDKWEYINQYVEKSLPPILAWSKKKIEL